MKKEINIEKKLFPNAGKLVKSKEGELSTEIIDAELDPIQCKFNNDGCVEINTKNLSYITVTAIRQVLFFTKLAYRWCYLMVRFI